MSSAAHAVVPNAAPNPVPNAGPNAAGDHAAALRRAASERAGRVDLLVLHVGEERFAVPLAASVEVLRLDGGAAGATAPRLQGLPVVDAAARFGAAGGARPRAAAIVRAGDALVALAVDAAVPVHGADLAAARPVPWPDDGTLLGVLPRGDTVVALVDVDALAPHATVHAAEGVPAAASEPSHPLAPARA